MLRVPQQHPGRKRRGRCCCVISERPTPSPAPKYPLTPIIPVRPRNSPVSPIIPACPERLARRVHTSAPLSPIIPVHPRIAPVSPIIPVLTQKQGGGALNFQLGILRRMPILSEQREPKALSGFSPSSLCSPLLTRHSLHSFPHHWQRLPYASYPLTYLPLHQVSM